MNVHGDNLKQKEAHETKYLDAEAKQFLKEIRKEYDKWAKANDELRGPISKPIKTDKDIIYKRVELFERYKNFIDKQNYAEKFDSRSNLHSSVLEEFIYYLFRDLVKDLSTTALIGKAHTYKDLFFVAVNFKDMLQNPSAAIEMKDHDFVIGVNIEAKMKCAGGVTEKSYLFQVPAVAIECKTYLDKTMLEGSSAAAEQLRFKNPNAIYIVVAEWLKLTDQINLGKYKVEQIYILRKQKNTDREFRYLPGYKKNPIYADAVEHLYNFVRSHLINDWQTGLTFGLEKGYLKQ